MKVQSSLCFIWSIEFSDEDSQMIWRQVYNIKDVDVAIEVDDTQIMQYVKFDNLIPFFPNTLHNQLIKW